MVVKIASKLVKSSEFMYLLSPNEYSYTHNHCLMKSTVKCVKLAKIDKIVSLIAILASLLQASNWTVLGHFKCWAVHWVNKAQVPIVFTVE